MSSTAPVKRRRDPGREHRDERDEREPDHQRRRGRGGALRVAARVVAREHARPRRRSAPPASRAPVGERADEPRREEGDADEDAASGAERPWQRSTCFVPRRVPKRPKRSSGEARARSTSERRRRCGSGAKRDGGSVAPSRTAAIGGTRVARIAGRRLATSVTRIPTSSDTTIVRVSKTRPLFGSVNPTASKSAKRPFASARPEEEADDRGERRPSTSDSTTIERQHLPSRRAERAQRRELARALRDRDRERVRDHEAAHEERDPGEREQEVLQEADEARRVGRVLLRLRARRCAPATCGGSTGRELASELRGDDARLRGDRDLVERPALSKRRCAVGRSKPASVAPPIVDDVAEPDDARTSSPLRPARRPATPIVSPTREVLLLRPSPGRSRPRSSRGHRRRRARAG